VSSVQSFLVPLHIILARRGYSETGGAESYLKRFAKALTEAGHHASLLCTDDWPDAEWPYGELIRIKASTPIRFANAVRRHRDPGSLLFSLERIWECDCYRAGDGLHRAWLTRRAEFEPALKKHLRFLNPKHSRILELEESLFKQRGARHVITNSHLVKSEIVREFAYPEEKISVVYNGLPVARSPLDLNAREEARRRWGLHRPTVLFAGSGWERKGLRYAIQAVRGLNSIQLIIAGSGKKPSRKAENVIFLGSVDDMSQPFAAADVFVLPTIYDPFSNACLEAMSFGLPVITTTANGFSEIIVPGIHGETIDRPDNVDALRAAIESWSIPEKRSQASNACKALAAQYTIDRNVDETVRVLKRVERNEFSRRGR
jgi:UDP-glucose:(heptosyl)LPS alpha-1,3-glucosyltransferase